jgi:hypothetical protein
VKKVILLIIVFVVPVACYIILTTGENHFKSLPYYEASGVVDTSVQTVNLPGNFELNGVITAIAIVKPNSKDTADRVYSGFSRVDKRFQAAKSVQFLSLYSEVDSSAQFFEFIKQFEGEKSRLSLHKIRMDNWNDVLDMLHLNQENNPAGKDIEAEFAVVLLDKSRQIRGYYDGLDYHDYTKVIDDIKVLLVEEKKKNE